MKKNISTTLAPAVSGTYSQAIQAGNSVYVSGQVPINPETQQLVTGDIPVHIHQVFKNLSAIAKAAGGSLDSIVKLTIYLKDMAYFPTINTIMTAYFQPPYPARVVVQVGELRKHASIEVDAILVLDK